jgi:DNA-binding NarL/FixJ family response regulator
VLLVAEDPVFSQLLRRHIEPLPAAVHEVRGSASGYPAPDVVVISLSPSVSANLAAQIIEAARAQSPTAAIITVSLPEHTPSSELLLSLGVSQHLDRSTSHPRDIATAVSGAVRS